MTAPVWVGATRYPWSPAAGAWMWRCDLINRCPHWHYRVDDCGYADTHSEALRLGLEHAAIEHPVEDLEAGARF